MAEKKPKKSFTTLDVSDDIGQKNDYVYQSDLDAEDIAKLDAVRPIDKGDSFLFDRHMYIRSADGKFFKVVALVLEEQAKGEAPPRFNEDEANSHLGLATESEEDDDAN